MSHLLPPPYLSVKLPIMEKTPSSELTPTRLGFPNEFPFEFDSPSFSPGFTSPGDSTETEDESSDDEEDFLAGLTRRLAPSTQRLPPPPPPLYKTEEKRQVAATSPQSTLSGLGSFSNSGSRSPILPSPPAPTSSFRRDNAWDVISAAAGEVARLKLGSYEPHHLPLQTPESLLRRQNAAFHAELQQQRLIEQMWLCSSLARIKLSEDRIPRRVVHEEGLFQDSRYVRPNHSTWLPPQHAVAPLKRPSAGTGVFLPRRYPTTPPSDSLKKPVNPPAMQSKVNQQNLNFDEFTNVLGPRRSQFDYECMLARSSLLARQGNFRSVNGGGCMNQDRRLPQDWMY